MDTTSVRNQTTASAMPVLAPVVFIVDDDISVREALEGLVSVAGWRPSSFASAQEFLDAPHEVCPTCAILDVTLPDLNGLDLQQRIAAERPEMPIIFVTGYGDIPMTVKAMKAGAVEFLTKPFADDALLQAIRNALVRSAIALGAATRMQALERRYASLSGREREVMVLVTSGMLNKQVGGRLGISEITVKAHRGRVMRKMEANSLADLVNIAGRLRLAKQGEEASRS